jgi:nucleoside-diphosphate-sugar epimerase
MIAAVTGGTGFVGRTVVQTHLRRGDEVRVLTRRKAPDLAGANIITGDLARGEIPRQFIEGADVLYHCAGELVNVKQMYAVHVDGTRKLLTAARGRIRRWVQLSSVGVYGPQREGMITETTVENPTGVYEVTKGESDRLVLEAGATGMLDVVVLRPSNIFGPSMPNQSLFGLIGAIDSGLFFYIGPPGASANYIPVDNVGDALILCGTSPAASGETFIVSAYRPMEDFVATIAAALGKAPPRLRLPRAPTRLVAAILSVVPGWPLSVSRVDALSGRAIYSTERIESKLGYQGRVSVEDALRATVRQWQTRRGSAVTA